MPDLPTVTAVRLTGARNRGDLPLLVLGPSLGASAAALWPETAAGLSDAFDLVAWDLPGHGHNRGLPDEPASLTDLAAGVLAVVDEILLQRDEVGGSFSYVGVGVGAAVGVQLLLDAPRRVRDAVLVDVVTSSAASPEAGLAAYDVRDRLGGINAPVLSVDAMIDDPRGLAGLVRAHVLGEAGAADDAQAEARLALESHLRDALDSGLSAAQIVEVLRGLDR